MYLIVLEAGKSKIKAPADLVSGENPFPGSETVIFSPCPHMVEGVGELPAVSLVRALIPSASKT